MDIENRQQNKIDAEFKTLINPTHTIRLIEQFLIENNLLNTLQVLQQGFANRSD